MDKIKNPVLFAKLLTGEILQYHYAADEPGVYEERYPELAKTLEYLGEGSFYSVDGKVSEHVRTKTQHFWRKKVDVSE